MVSVDLFTDGCRSFLLQLSDKSETTRMQSAAYDNLTTLRKRSKRRSRKKRDNVGWLGYAGGLLARQSTQLS